MLLSSHYLAIHNQYAAIIKNRNKTRNSIVIPKRIVAAVKKPRPRSPRAFQSAIERPLTSSACCVAAVGAVAVGADGDDDVCVSVHVRLCVFSFSGLSV